VPVAGRPAARLIERVHETFRPANLLDPDQPAGHEAAYKQHSMAGSALRLPEPPRQDILITTHPRLLLIISTRGSGAAAHILIADRLGASGCEALTPVIYLLRDGFERSDELRRIALRCRQDDVPLWLLAELPPAPSDDQGPYRRLHDRSERHDAALAAWRRGQGSLPALAAGEMVRL
jgi:hypothetical protein